MRCKKHLCDVSSTVGVCASCLRERLSALIAAQAQLARASLEDATPATFSRKSDAHPPPLLFPRSVSPYVTRRKSDDTATTPSSWSSHNHLRFYSTPQVGPTYNTTTASAATTGDFSTSRSFNKKLYSKFSLFSNLFRSRSEKLNSDHTGPVSSSSSPSWFTTVLSTRQKKQSRLFSMDFNGTTGCRHRPAATDRGMSPVRGAEFDANCEDCDRSPSGSGCSSESPQGWKKTPARGGRAKSGHSRNVSSAGLAFCLSPLVRASPNRHWNHQHHHKGGLPPDMGLSGEMRVAVKPHLSTAASFCANRSRKLADIGRVNRNR